MTDAPWIQVESRPREPEESRQTLEFKLLVPPHEVPQAVRGEFDKQINRFVIEIRYLDDEPFEKTTVDDIVCLRIGKKSQRLLSIELDTAKIDVKSVQIEVQSVVEQEIKKAIGKLLQGKRGQAERENYALAVEAIESAGSSFLNPSSLVSA